jgi:Mor family transcriptional regulator
MKRKWTTNEVWAVMQDVADGDSLPVIARRMNLSYSALYQVVRRFTQQPTLYAAIAEGFRRGYLR